MSDYIPNGKPFVDMTLPELQKAYVRMSRDVSIHRRNLDRAIDRYVEHMLEMKDLEWIIKARAAL